MKANQVVSYEINTEDGTITFTVKGHSPLVMDMTKLHSDNINRAAFVGMAQVRIVDAAAVNRADKDGNLLDEAERTRIKYERMKKLVDHYESGSADWNVRVSQKAETDHSLTLRAMEQVLGRDRAGVEAAIAQWTNSGHGSRGIILEAWAARADVAEAIREYKAERTANVDSDKMLAELTGE